VIVAGVFGGVASGLLGIGGGVMMIPLLVVFAGLGQHRAHATSLAAIIPIAAVGAVGFALQDDVGVAIALALGAGAVVGAPLGARAMSRMSDRLLKIVFTVLQIAVGMYLLVS
jgi:uncharacterized membrane protein YfcA